MVKQIPFFCFPEFPGQRHKDVAETFTFALQDVSGDRRYGFCHRSSAADGTAECLCILSKFAWFSLFAELMVLVQARRNVSQASVNSILDAVLRVPFPFPGERFSVRAPSFSPVMDDVHFLTRPDDDSTPSADVSLEPLFRSLDLTAVLALFSCALEERRIMFTSSDLSRLSACVAALNALLFPFSWQHIYIPILPQNLLSYVCAPMPFIVGVDSGLIPQVMKLPTEAIVHVDLDARQVSGSEDHAALPGFATLHDTLRRTFATARGGFDHDEVSQAFLRFFISVFGHYRVYMEPKESGDDAYSFNHELFVSEQPPARKPFLDAFRQTQMYVQWVQDRTALLKRGVTLPPGAFEAECAKLVPHAYGIHGRKPNDSVAKKMLGFTDAMASRLATKISQSTVTQSAQAGFAKIASQTSDKLKIDTSAFKSFAIKMTTPTLLGGGSGYAAAVPDSPSQPPAVSAHLPAAPKKTSTPTSSLPSLPTLPKASVTTSAAAPKPTHQPTAPVQPKKSANSLDDLFGSSDGFGDGFGVQATASSANKTAQAPATTTAPVPTFDERLGLFELALSFPDLHKTVCPAGVDGLTLVDRPERKLRKDPSVVLALSPPTTTIAKPPSTKSSENSPDTWFPAPSAASPFGPDPFFAAPAASAAPSKAVPPKPVMTTTTASAVKSSTSDSSLDDFFGVPSVPSPHRVPTPTMTPPHFAQAATTATPFGGLHLTSAMPSVGFGSGSMKPSLSMDSLSATRPPTAGATTTAVPKSNTMFFPQSSVSGADQVNHFLNQVAPSTAAASRGVAPAPVRPTTTPAFPSSDPFANFASFAQPQPKPVSAAVPTQPKLGGATTMGFPPSNAQFFDPFESFGGTSSVQPPKPATVAPKSTPNSRPIDFDPF